MIYIILGLILISLVAGFIAYLSITKNSELKKDITSLNQQLSNATSLLMKMEEANKTYAQRIETLTKGTDSDRFNAAASIMSNGKAPPTQPATKP